jgi:glucose-6-phosphate-specific signal transduction histidine kinase
MYFCTGKLEKTIADEIIKHEMNIENDVSINLNNIINEQIAAVKKQKNIVTKCHQDNETVKRNLLVCLAF